MADLLVTTGPALFYVGVGQPRQMQLLGISQSKPVIEKIPTWTPLFNSVGCDSPFDMQYHGETATISAVLNICDGYVYRQLTRRPWQATAGWVGAGVAGIMPPGLTTRWERGALLAHQRLGAPLVVIFPGARQDMAQAAGMPDGYFFPCTALAQDREVDGSEVQERPLAFLAQPVYVPLSTTANVPNRGGFTLYTTGAFGSPPPLSGYALDVLAKWGGRGYEAINGPPDSSPTYGMLPRYLNLTLGATGGVQLTSITNLTTPQQSLPVPPRLTSPNT